MVCKACLLLHLFVDFFLVCEQKRVRGKSSGGSGRTNEAAFWTNPQFLVTLDDVDPEDNENMSTLIVSLLQKYTREKRTQNKGESCEQFIQFRLYRILADSDAEQAKKTGKRLYASQLERCATSGPYINLRDITKRFRIGITNLVFFCLFFLIQLRQKLSFKCPGTT